MFLILFGRKLFLAPIPHEPHNILDVGTGTGIWAIDVADKYPSASVIGTDISDIQPEWVPPNCQFELDNANEDWTFQWEFDLIHCRLLHGAVEENKLIQQSFKALKRGGWFEIKEFALPIRCNDNTLEGTALAAWGNAMKEASGRINNAFDRPHKYRLWMEEAGFHKVEESCYHVPLNTWPKDSKLKEIGQWQAANLVAGLEGFSLDLFVKYFGWKEEEVKAFLVAVRKDILDRRIHAYATLVCVIGQKPRAEAGSQEQDPG
jgi:SAM-dependent methyltransferase